MSRNPTLRPTALSLLALALLVLGGMSFIQRVGVAEPVLGVEWVQSSAGPVALNVEARSQAWESGLRPGDLLLRVDGVPVPNSLDARQIPWTAADSAAMRLEVLRGNENLTLLLRTDWHLRPEPYTYLAIVGLAFWVSGMFIAWRWPLIRGSLLYTLLALCLFAYFTVSHTGRADRMDWVFYWADILAEALVPLLVLQLALALARRTLKARRILLAVAYCGSALLLLAAVWLSPGALGGALRFADPLLPLELRDRVALLALAGSLIFAMGLFVKSYRRSSSAMHRGQMRWLLWGLAIGFGPFVALYAVPWSLGAPDLPAWAQFVSVVPILFVPTAFTASLARYRLDDLDLFLVRGFAEVTAVFCVFGIYAATMFLVREGVSGFLPVTRSGARYFGLLCMVVAYPPVRGWVRSAVDRAFYSKRYSYRSTLLDWARELNAETDLPSLLEHLRSRVCDTLGVTRAEVLIRDGDRLFRAASQRDTDETLELASEAVDRLEHGSYLHLDEGALAAAPWVSYLVSMKVKGRLRALLAISDRGPGGEPLNSEDRTLLITLCAHAATAIEAARLVLEVRQRAAEIERLHSRHARILESSSVGLLLLDGTGRIQAWNRALEEIYGLGRDEAIGKAPGEVFPLHVARRIGRESRASALDREVRIFRLSLINRRGDRLIVNLGISPVDDDADGEDARVVTFDDVSQRVKLEDQLLRQERLASLGLLAAGVAHEINTPLTGISSYTQLLREECDGDDPRRALLDKIETQTGRASAITRSLLNLARPERTALDAVDLNETIEEVLQLFEPQVRGRGIELRARLAAGLPPIAGHRGKLQQVLLNLLINARDAVAEGGRIEIHSEHRGDRVSVRISDDGEGIAEEDLPSIFDPFFTTKGRGKGTGMGLSISYGIVQEHSGEIHVESRFGEFTRFTVELPVAGATPAAVRHG